MADPLAMLKRKKYRDYAYILTLIQRDDTGTLGPWAERLAKQLEKDQSEGFANTDAWIQRTLPRTQWAQNRTALQEAGEIEFAQGQTPSGRADYEASINDRRLAIGEMASRIGVTLSEQELDDIARKARLEKLNDVEVQRLLYPYLEEDLADGVDLAGDAGANQTSLKTWAARNGIDLDNNAISKYIMNMTKNNQTLDDVKQEIRMTYLRGAFPAWADRIEAGYDPEDIVSPYRASAAKLLEVDADQLGFDDPLIKMSLQNVGADGKPSVLPLYEFERKVREDPRWDKTNNAYATYTQVGQDLLKMFGFR